MTTLTFAKAALIRPQASAANLPLFWEKDVCGFYCHLLSLRQFSVGLHGDLDLFILHLNWLCFPAIMLAGLFCFWNCHFLPTEGRIFDLSWYLRAKFDFLAMAGSSLKASPVSWASKPYTGSGFRG